jgi:hypothetical protein
MIKCVEVGAEWRAEMGALQIAGNKKGPTFR